MKKALVNLSGYNQYATALKVTIGMIVAAGITLWGVFKYIDKTEDHDINTDKSITMIVDDQKNILVGIDYLTKQLDSINKEVSGIKDNMWLQGEELVRLRKSYILYLKKNVEHTEQFMEYVEGLVDEKKNDKGSFLIQGTN